MVACDPGEVALAPVRPLRHRVAAGAATSALQAAALQAAALQAAALGWLLARAIARPGEQLAEAARRAGAGAVAFRSSQGAA